MDNHRLQAQRRERLVSLIKQGVAVVRTAPERARNRDSTYPYRFDSYFYYLSGFPEPEAVLVLIAGAKPKSILFCREKNPEREIWDGFRYGPDQAREIFAFDEAHPISDLDELMPQLLADQPSVFCDVGSDGDWDSRVIGWINKVRAQVRSGVTAPAEICDIRLFVDDMRLIKDPHELGTMRRAAAISTEAHRRAMRATRPGLREYEVEAEIVHEFRRRGAQAPAYTPIVAGGANSCVLHYVQNDAILKDGDLLLIDAGCELDGYASDITRTFPVGGKFAGPQRDIYEMVLAAQAAAIAEVKPGAEWENPHNAAVKVLAQGMVDLGLCKGTVNSAIESGDYRRFFMHRTGHWLGLDVHDAGDYKRNGKWVELNPGMVLTVEPGCYVRPGEGVPEKFWNIGVRIEDDALVTGNGCEIITTAAPKKIEDIESLMRA
ncbi:MAG TPA: aminopeptidase P N-terminal domain-containing protein [Burkholderiales bacterium]|nr:aminopeptidase P N-terminal domain-containing protein [Burkholderiales bacterium]